MDNMKKEALKLFKNIYSNLTIENRYKVSNIICFYSYLIKTIDDKIICELTKTKDISINEDTKTMIYYIIISVLRLDSIKEHEVFRLSNNEIEKYYRMQLVLCATNRLNDDYNEIKSFNEIKIENDERISFMQMMTIIYHNNNKEYKENDFNNYETIFNEYLKIVNLYFDSIIKSYERIEKNIIINKALSIIADYSGAIISVFTAIGVLVQMYQTENKEKKTQKYCKRCKMMVNPTFHDLCPNCDEELS